MATAKKPAAKKAPVQKENTVEAPLVSFQKNPLGNTKTDYTN